MDARDAVGTVRALWRFPVKSMLGEELDSVELGQGGVVGDRAYAVVDKETGKVASAKHPKLWPDLLKCRAAFVDEPRADDPVPARIELADGTSVQSDAADVDGVLSRFFGRDVELSSAADDGYTIDQYHPDEEDYDPDGHRDEVVEAALGAAFFNERGLPSAVPEGSFFDLFPLSVLTTATLERLSELEPESDFDLRRFRMNVIVDTPANGGFVENDWVGRALAIGDQVRVGVALPDPRCCMPSLAQDGIERDPKILKALAKHNRIDVAGSLYPCAGVYAVAHATGTIRKDDRVSLA